MKTDKEIRGYLMKKCKPFCLGYTTLRFLYLSRQPSQILTSQAKIRVVFNHSWKYRTGYQNFIHVSYVGNTYFHTLRSFKLTARTPQNYVRVIPGGQKHKENLARWHTVKTTAQTLVPFFNASSTMHRKNLATKNVIHRTQHASEAAVTGERRKFY